MGQPLKWTTREATSSAVCNLLDRCGGKPLKASSNQDFILAQKVGCLQQSLPFEFQDQWALLHKSPDGQSSPVPGQTYPTTSVTGMPRAVKPFRTATLTWNSAT